MEKKGEEGKGGAKAGQQLMNTVVIERLGIGSLTNRAALPPPPYLPQFRGNRSPRYFIDMPAIDIHRSR